MRFTRVSACSVVAVAALFAAGCGSGTAGGESGEIVLGLVEDTSGPGAAYSKITSASVRAAVDDINAKGGVIGKKLKVASADDGSDPSKSPTVTRKLIGDGAAAVLFSTGSGAVIADKTVMHQSKVVGMAPTSAADELVTPPDDDYFYIQVPTVAQQAQAFVGAFRAAGVKKLAVFSDDTPTIAAYDKVLVPAFRKAGIAIARQEQAAVTATDVTAQVSRIRDAKPDAVLATTVGGQIEVLFHNTAHKVMPDVQRFSLASIGNQPQSWKLANKGALDGLVYTSHVAPDNPRTKKLRTSLTTKRGAGFTMTDYDADAYNSVQLIKDAIERGKSADPAKIHEALGRTAKFPSYFGQKDFTVSFTGSKHAGADGPCGLVFTRFDGEKPGGKWPAYQPTCH